MFESLYDWLKDISFYLILMTAVLYVLPSNSYRRYIRFFTGLVLILLLVTPILSILGMEKDIGKELERQFETKFKIEEVDSDIRESVQIEVEEIVIEP